MQDIYDSYARSSVFSHQSEVGFFQLGHRYLKHYYAKYLPQDKTAPILEIGCGQGRFLKVLKDLGYQAIYGIDCSKDQIAYGETKLGLEGYLEQIDACEFLLQSSPDQYEVILLLDVLEHMPLEVSIKVLQLCHRALRPGGRLLVQVPNGLAPLSPQMYGDVTHHRSYTVYSMRQSFLLAGYEEMVFQSQPPLIHGIKSLIRRIIWEAIINPFITFYMLIASGTAMGGIYTPNLFAVATKTNNKT